MSKKLDPVVVENVLSQIDSSKDVCNVVERLKNYSIPKTMEIIDSMNTLCASTVLLMFCLKADNGDKYAKELLANAIALNIRGTNCLDHVYGESL